MPDATPSTLDPAATRASIPFAPLMVALRRAVVEHGDQRIGCPNRLVLPLKDGATLLSMAAVADDIAIHKLISVAPRNARVGLPAILGSMTVLDPATGEALLILDGPTVTGLRTAALSMLALNVLHRGPASRALLIGTGVQAQYHVDALAALRPDISLCVSASSQLAAAAFCERNVGFPGGIDVASDGRKFDVVFTCTTSHTPVYVDAANQGTLVVAVGSYRPDAAEIAAGTVRRSEIYVDDRDGARHEAGDLIQAGVHWDDVRPLSSVLGATDFAPTRPILFKSVGCAAWDLAAARVALATRHDVGASDRRCG